MDPTENKNQFTDDKIKRLKEAMPKATYGFDDMDWFDFEDLDALLGRLEAAERYAEAGKSLLYDDHKMSAEEAFKVFDAARAEWKNRARKSA